MADPVLKQRDNSPAVKEAQHLLNRAGAILDPDGDFGGGTLRAVREFRAAQGLPPGDTIDAVVWAKLRALPEPVPDLLSRAVAFIAREEVGGRDFYDKSCAMPIWPGGASGVTIGVGYDLGYQANFEKDWAGLLPASTLAKLRPWVGVKGEAAAAGPAQLSGITIPWSAAWHGYIVRTLPQEIVTTRGAFPVKPGAALPGLCFGVLVSLVYNRGAAMQDNSANDRRREMRQIRDAVAAGEFGKVPDLILAMRRLWPAGNGLIGRREREAKLFREGLG